MNTIGIDMIDGMEWRPVMVIRGRVVGQSLPRVIRIPIHMVDYLYVYACSSIALLYNIYYKVITIGDVILCEDARINGGMGGIWS